MPIRPDLRKFYGRHWREVVRRRIIRRARNRCEQCGVPNSRIVVRFGGAWLDTESGKWRDSAGRLGPLDVAEIERQVHVILTVAHLNHVPGDDRDENLAALCQWCHLHFDQTHHAATRAGRKDQRRPLLRQAGLEAA